MMLSEIMSTDVVTLTPEMSLRDAVGILIAEEITGAPVVANGRVVGVLSITDILELEGSTPGVPTERPEQAEWGEVDIEPGGWEAGNEPLASFFTDLWADAGAGLVERFDEVEHAEWDILDEQTVEEAMTHALLSLPPDADVHEAARKMLDAGIHRILVTEGSELVGIATTIDIVRAVAERRLVPAEIGESG